MNNGRTEWTVADAAVLFKEPVEDLVSDFAIEAISGGSEYQLNQMVQLIFPVVSFPLRPAVGSPHAKRG